jgi:hypothetical protein
MDAGIFSFIQPLPAGRGYPFPFERVKDGFA